MDEEPSTREAVVGWVGWLVLTVGFVALLVGVVWRVVKARGKVDEEPFPWKAVTFFLGWLLITAAFLAILGDIAWAAVTGDEPPLAFDLIILCAGPGTVIMKFSVREG